MHILVDAKERGGLDTNISKYRRPHPLLQSSVENLLLTVREILILSLAGVCGPSSDNFGSFHFLKRTPGSHFDSTRPPYLRSPTARPRSTHSNTLNSHPRPTSPS